MFDAHGPWSRTSAAVIVTVLVSAACAAETTESDTNQRPAVNSVRDGGYHGTLLEPAAKRPDLRLRDTSGRWFDFRARPPGEATMVFFGYTHCPDACPTTMADLGIAYRQMSPEVQRNVTVVFVTEDPKRDTPRVLRGWLDRFHQDFVGLIGGPKRTAETLKELHLPRTRINPNPETPIVHPPGHHHGDTGSHHGNDYGVDHSGIVYVFGPRDRALIYTGGTKPSEYAADLTRIVS